MSLFVKILTFFAGSYVGYSGIMRLNHEMERRKSKFLFDCDSISAIYTNAPSPHLTQPRDTSANNPLVFSNIKDANHKMAVGMVKLYTKIYELKMKAQQKLN